MDERYVCDIVERAYQYFRTKERTIPNRLMAVDYALSASKAFDKACENKNYWVAMRLVDPLLGLERYAYKK